MQYKPETEKLNIMGDSYMPVVKPLSLAEDHEVQRTRKIFMIIVGVCLALSVVTLVVAIFGSGIENNSEDVRRVTQVGQALIAILFYGFGLLVAHRYSETGLRVFAWLCIIELVIMAIGLVFFLFVIIAALFVVSYADQGHKAAVTIAALMGSFIITVIYIAAFVLSVIIVKFAFKLARLIDANRRLIIQQI